MIRLLLALVLLLAGVTPSVRVVVEATNTWVAYYTPYTYPHPLRGESEPPADPGEKPVWILK